MGLFFIQILITSVFLLIIANLVSGFVIKGFGVAMVAALVLGVLNAFVRPLMVWLTLPVTVLTFGLFLFVINALMLQFAGALVPGVRIAGFGTAFIGSILLTLFNMIAVYLFGSYDAHLWVSAN